MKLKAEVKPEEGDTNAKDEDDNDDDPHPGNRGKLQMDATVCDADIKYPTDLNLLNQSRQKNSEADTKNVKSDGKRQNAIRLQESLVRVNVDIVCMISVPDWPRRQTVFCLITKKVDER